MPPEALAAIRGVPVDPVVLGAVVYMGWVALLRRQVSLTQEARFTL